MQRATPSPRSRWLGLIAFGIMLVAATIAMPFWTSAAEVRGDDEVTIGTTETIDDDLFVVTGDFELAGTASRDVFVVAGQVEITGEVGGSLNVAAGDTDVSGRVEGSVRVTGGNVTVSGAIGGDLVVLGGRAKIEPGAVIGGDAQVYGGTLDMQGTIQGSLTGSIGDVSLDGTVGGNVDIDVQRLDVGASAEIAGDLVYVSQSEADIAAGSTVTGEIDRQTISPWGGGDGLRGRFFSPLARTVWMLITGAIFIGVAPRLVSALNENARRPLLALIVGLISLLAVPAAAVLLAITVIGIPAGVIVLLTYIVALYLSQFVVGQWIGSLLLPRSWNDGSRGFLLLSMTLGVLIIAALRFFLPVAWIAAFVNLLVVIMGMGLVVLLVRQLRPWYVEDRSGA